jgi:hypothetical protein
MLTIIHLLTLPLSLEVNSGPRDRNPSRTAKRQPLVAVQEPPPHLLARPLAPTAATATTASTLASQAVDRTPFRFVSSSESLQTKQHGNRSVDTPPRATRASAASDSLLQAVDTPPRATRASAASYKPSTRLQEPHEPLQRPTASSSRLQEPQQSLQRRQPPTGRRIASKSHKGLCSVRQPPTSCCLASKSHNKPSTRPTSLCKSLQRAVTSTPTTRATRHHEYPHRNPRVCLYP